MALYKRQTLNETTDDAYTALPASRCWQQIMHIMMMMMMMMMPTWHDDCDDSISVGFDETSVVVSGGGGDFVYVGEDGGD